MTRGHRLVLIYNLVHKGQGPAPAPADHVTAIDAVRRVVAGWQAEEAPPRKLVFMLEHRCAAGAGLVAVGSRPDLAAPRASGRAPPHLPATHPYAPARSPAELAWPVHAGTRGTGCARAWLL